MYPVTGTQRAELNTSLSLSPPQEAAESSEITTQSPFSQLDKTKDKIKLTGGSSKKLLHGRLCLINTLV